MPTVTTMVQGTAAVVQPYLFEPSDSDSDQETKARASENSSLTTMSPLIYALEAIYKAKNEEFVLLYDTNRFNNLHNLPHTQCTLVWR